METSGKVRGLLTVVALLTASVITFNASSYADDVQEVRPSEIVISDKGNSKLDSEFNRLVCALDEMPSLPSSQKGVSILDEKNIPSSPNLG